MDIQISGYYDHVSYLQQHNLVCFPPPPFPLFTASFGFTFNFHFYLNQFTFLFLNNTDIEFDGYHWNGLSSISPTILIVAMTFKIENQWDATKL